MTEKNTNYLRQMIVVRKDLCMPIGKFGAMVAHAAMTFIAKNLKAKMVGLQPDCFGEDRWQWLTELDPGLEDLEQLSMAKIVLAVDNEAQLLNVDEAARAAGLEVHRVYDIGYSHNKPRDFVCIAIGPDWPDKLRPVTGHLKVYR